MRIAQVVTMKESVPPHSKNGLEFIVSWLTEELVRRGHEVTLFAPADSKTTARLVSLIPTGTSNDPITESGSPHFSILNTLRAGSMADQFDIIHCHDFFGGLITPFTDVPIVQTLHHPYRDEFLARFIPDATYAGHLQFFIEQYAKIHYVPISNNQEEFFKAAEPYYFKKYHMIYNGIPVEQFTYNDTPQGYLLYLGYINKDKGADVAVNVARKLKKRLILAGNNRGAEQFFQKSIQPYLSDDIQYVGSADFSQKVELYKNADALLTPLYWHEPFGLTLVEAQACGTPVISFNKGAAPELIKSGKTGFVVETEEDMVEAVQKVGNLSRQACRDWVEEKFSVTRMVDDYERHYEELLGV